MRKGLIALGVAVAVAWPTEAILGTYGAFKLARTGYTIAMEISIGSFSDSDREADAYRAREAAIAAQVQPRLPGYDAWFRRALAGKHSYAGWLDGLDRGRATATDQDYKWRLPGPEAPPPPSPPPGARPSPLGAYLGDRPVELYLHMNAAQPPVAQTRALLGFVLAQIELGDSEPLRLPGPGVDWPLSRRLEHAARGDSFQGQGPLLARLLFDVRGQAPALERFAADATNPAPERALAGLAAAALAYRPLRAADWERLAAANADRRLLWTWALALGPTSEAASREADLQKRLPLSDEDQSSFGAEYLRVAPR
jgi:hypothetical protein